MALGDITRRELVGIAGLAAITGMAREARAASPVDEFVRVAADHWTFETSISRSRFVPFGANLVLTSKDDLDNFGPRYASLRYDLLLRACKGRGINMLKVFLPIGSLLPDPQQPGTAHVASKYLDNLDDFLGLAHDHGIRAVICLSEWGVAGCKWWQDGGQYFGRKPWRTDAGPDSIDILCAFWNTLASRLRDNPTVFSYTLCAEWSMPNGNMTPPWSPPPKEIGLVQGPIAEWYWRAFVMAKYGSLDRLNRAWGVRHQRPDDIRIVNYDYDEAAHRYKDTEQKILDYQNYREWTTLRYFRPQIAAIRTADANHMVTISNHMRSWNLWEGAARHFLGYTPAEETPYIDYMTYHANYAEGEVSNNRPVEKVVREVEVMARFHHAGKPMPLIIEEFTYATPDELRTARAQEAIVRGTIGHVSGWMTWYLQFPEGSYGAETADTPYEMAWLDADLRPTSWGDAARWLAGDLAIADLRRRAPRRVVKLDRATEVVPKKLGILASNYMDYDPAKNPTDYIVRHEKDLDLKLPGDPDRRPNPQGTRNR